MPRRKLLALLTLAFAGVLGVAPPFTLLKRPARFSATPVVSEHSNDAVNQLAREELESIGAKDVRFMDQRWYFDAGSNFDVTRLLEVRHVQSVRSIVLLADSQRSEGLRLDAMIKRGNWKALEDLAAFVPCSGWCCRAAARGAAKRRWPNGTQELEAALHRRFGWPIQKPGRLADVTVHMQLFRNKLLLEVALLKQRRPVLGGGWPHRGLGHVEAWALARTLDLKADEVVLDPMCGKGTLLAEVATWWPSTRLIGVDVDPKQLQRCRENFQWLQREVSLHLANVTDDGLAAVGMVDRVLVAPPWNKQFAVQGQLQDFFEQMFRAIFGVLKPDGKLAPWRSCSAVRWPEVSPTRIQGLCGEESAERAGRFTVLSPGPC
ncbi:unnamed protein product [Cladocopium goreaui]|uniref:THUMP domain-containing protein 2 n=1 Tax=Cladocopium goreaui TaxID=2562237 RepID=A0A9P1C6C6_9DINO|nr:unnamed protein product [Cladocopium goreaui]